MTTTPTELFSDLPAPIAQALVARGFTELTAVQRAVVEAESAGRDLRISSRTGSGKTVAIGLALAAHFLEKPADTQPRRSGDAAAHPRALVIVPTRELAAQVREELKWLFAGLPGATVEVVTGGTSILRERIALSRRPAFVVGTPGRLLDHLRNDALACDAIEHVILDEADQMLDMGFKDELDAILEQLPEQRASHLVSATFPHAVKALADRFQRNALTVQGTKLGDAHPDIEHVAYTIRRHETYAALVNVLLLAGDSRCLLFVNRRVDATELAEKLAADGFGAAPFSGELPQAQRTRTLNAFRTGLLPILVSTDVAARGIDVPDISTVIHVDPPRNPDAYVHRSGRTGRAGRTGRSILLVVGADSRKVGRMLSATRVPVSWQNVPRPEAVERALDERARQALLARLDESAPTESQRLAAKQLLVDRDPVEIVASLLEVAKPNPPRAPMPVEGMDPFFDAGRGKRGRDARDPRDARGARDRGTAREDRPAYADRPDRDARPVRERPAPGDFTTFSVTWGEKTGATTPRLLSHVCRRGELTSDQIGSIRVFAKNSFVDVANDVAEAFAARVAVPDERDPGIAIERARPRAPRPQAERPWTGPPARSPGRADGRPDARSAGRPDMPARGRPKRRDGDEGPVRTFDRSSTRERAFKPPFKARRVPNADEAIAGGPKPGAGPRSSRERASGAGDFSERPDRPNRADRPRSPKHARKPGGRPPFGESGKAPFRPGPKAGARPGPRSGPKPHRKGPRKPGAGGPPARGRR